MSKLILSKLSFQASIADDYFESGIVKMAISSKMSLPKLSFRASTADDFFNDDSAKMAGIPKPIFDQTEISAWQGFNQDDLVLSEFTEHLGKPRSVKSEKNGNVWYWKTLDVSLTKRGKWGYRVVRFPATQPVLAAISPILENLPSRPSKDKQARRKAKRALRKGELVHCDGKPAAQLRTQEIAWNFPGSYSYSETESWMIRLVAFVISANKLARIRCIEPEPSKHGGFKQCADGATNGLITFYFESASRRATWQGKIYCKRLAPGKPWCIRFEVTLSPNFAGIIW